MRLLILEDEDALREQLHRQLSEAGYAVDTAADGREGQYLGEEIPFDLAVVDLGLPEKDGISVIRAWREAGRDFPVLILTARGRWEEKVEGLEAGADDYLVKPFHPEELQARIRALLRRAAGRANPVIRSGPLAVDTRSQTVTRQGEAVDLTAYEYRLLEYLLLHAGEVVSKTDLTEHLYAQDFDRDSNTIEVFVGRLRRKLDPDNTWHPIETLRGRGYRWAPETE